MHWDYIDGKRNQQWYLGDSKDQFNQLSAMGWCLGAVYDTDCPSARLVVDECKTIKKGQFWSFYWK